MPSNFSAPSSVDDSRNLSQWIQYTAEKSPDHPLFAYASSGSQTHVLTWSAVGAAVEKAACLVDSHFNVTGTSSEAELPPVIGILANLDTITYHTIYLGILRAGGTGFLISTRNSPAAVSHLLKKTGTHKLFVSVDQQVQALVSAVVDLATEEDYLVDVQTVPSFQTLFENDGARFPVAGGLKAKIDSPAVILQSSGSTSLPKPIVASHHTVLQWARLTELQVAGTDLSMERLAVHALPVYHGMGFYVTFWALVTGLTLTVFPPQMPPVVPSPSNFLESAVASQSTFVICVPLFLEMWSRDADAVEHLRRFKGIGFGGGPFNHAIGDELVQAGVPLIGLYGTTETGPVTVMATRDPGDTEWEWLKLSSHVNAEFLPQEEPTEFEIVYVECETHCPVVFNCTVDGRRAFATNDIVIRHPSDPLKFKIFGRKDDLIVLSTGEKTNPGPIEVSICRNPLIYAAVMFGTGQDRNGIIIQPAKGYEFHPADTTKLFQFRNDIWPSIEQANRFSPTHSRLLKEMVLVTNPSRPIEMTAKGTPRRAATLEAYKVEIEAAYDAFEASEPTHIAPPAKWNLEELLTYVRQVVHHTMEKQMGDHADIFEQGADSLRATHIRNFLIHGATQAGKDAARCLSQDFVYANPTITRLAERLLVIFEAGRADGERDKSLKLEEIESTICELSAHFSQDRNGKVPRTSTTEVVLLTGTTGGLGSQLLANLTASSDVSHIYAVNRKSNDGGKSLRCRQIEALTKRGLDCTIVDSPKVTLVEGNTAIKSLDVAPIIYDEICNKITLIIHNAWKVNLKLGFTSFEQNIRSVRTLIDLALDSPFQTHQESYTRALWESSEIVDWNVERQGRPPETSINDPTIVLGNGYGESKFAGERILENAARATPLRPVIVRIGQMTGTSNGAWNSRDWLPSIVRSGQVLGVLPARSDHIAWISLDIAARAIFEFRDSNSRYIHLRHPDPVPWNTIFETFASQLKVPLVSWSEWLTRLERCDEGAERNPAAYLLDFFRRSANTSHKDREAPGIPLLDMTNGVKASHTLAGDCLPKSCPNDAELWMTHWKAVGLLTDDSPEK